MRTAERAREGVDEAAVAPGPAEPGARAALAVFAAVEVGALWLYLAVGHFQWFFWDEWDFLAGRSATNIHDLLRPHNEHWSTVPILVYRVWFALFGLHSYVPYQVLIVTLHLTVAALLWVVMRRAGVHPWIATAGASLFALLGAGNQDIIWAFQIGFVGSVAFGLVQLLLTDHDGGISRRDGAGVVAGLLALMCSGVGVAMVATTGIATLLRRGWRAALLQTAPLGAVFLVWWFRYDRDAYKTSGHVITVSKMVRFAAVGFWGAFGALGQVPGIGFALAAVLVVGLALAWRHITWAEWRVRAAVPTALLLGGAVFMLITASGRAGYFGSSFAKSSRYLHIMSAMILPALAIAADALVRRWRVLLALVVALFLIGIPGNIGKLVDARHSEQKLQSSYRTMILGLPAVPAAKVVPRSVHPDREFAAAVTIGWLRKGVAQGKIPRVSHVPLFVAATDQFRLSLTQANATPATRVSTCTPLRASRTVHLERGESVTVVGAKVLAGPPSATWALSFDPAFGERLVDEIGPLDVALRSSDVHRLAYLCGSSANG